MNVAKHASHVRSFILGLLLAWLLKALWLVFGSVVIHRQPVLDPFFPQPLQQLPIAVLFYLAPVLLAAVALVSRRPRLLALTLIQFIISSAALLCHQTTYNDATFVTTLWTAGIALWFTQRPMTDSGAPQKLAQLTQLLISMLFIGGLAGKITPGYLSGETLYEIYFADRQHYFFNWIRAAVEPDKLRVVAMGYSFFVISSEALLASLALWPARLGLPIAIAALSTLPVLNNFLLFSVTAGPLTLAITALSLLRTEGAPCLAPPARCSIGKRLDDLST